MELETQPVLTKSPAKRKQAWLNILLEVDRKQIPGDIVECGIWRGGNLITARQVLPTRKVWGFDTFAGMTTPGRFDVSRGGTKAIDKMKLKKGAWTACSLQECKQFMNEAGVLDDKLVQFVVGDVCRTLREPDNLPERIAVLRLDTDWYESTLAELKYLYPLLSPGGCLVVDDYGHWVGCRKAVDEYFKHRSVLTMIDYTAGYHWKA